MQQNKYILLKQQILALEAERKPLLKRLLQDEPMIEGSYQERLGRCGKSGCHCALRPIHPVTQISRWKEDKLCRKLVRVADRSRVKQLVLTYQMHKKAISRLTAITTIQKSKFKNIMKLASQDYQ